METNNRISNRFKFHLLTIFAIVGINILCFSKTFIRFDGGANISTISLFQQIQSPIGISSGSIFNGYIGCYTGYSISKLVSMELGIKLTGKGNSANFSAFEPTSIKADFRKYYLEIPFNFQYKLNNQLRGLFIFGGPYLGYALWGNTNTNGSINLFYGTLSNNTINLYPPLSNSPNKNIVFGNNPSSDEKLIDLGANLGAGFEYKKVQIRIQYGLGLRNLIAGTNENALIKAIYNKVFSFGVSYILN